MPATIKDIARETGLSLSTISKYLNKKSIQEKNRVLIEEAIRKLGYRPNRIAQSLRSDRTMTVAILLPDLGNYFWGDLVYSISSFFAELDYTVIECAYNYDPAAEKETIRYLAAKKVDGVIFLPVDAEDVSYRFLQEAKIPVVFLDQYPARLEKLPVDTVRSDNEKGGKRLAEYLVSKGHRRIGVISPAERSSTVAERIRGFREGCRSAGQTEICCSDPVRFIVKDEVVMDMAKGYFRKMMEAEAAPTAVFCTNYITAMGVLVEAVNREVSIPQDVSVVCYDDDPIFRSMASPITCVAQDLKQMGEEASKLLMKRIKGDWSDFPAVKTVDVDFHERESVRELEKLECV